MCFSWWHRAASPNCNFSLSALASESVPATPWREEISCQGPECTNRPQWPWPASSGASTYPWGLTGDSWTFSPCLAGASVTAPAPESALERPGWTLGLATHIFAWRSPCHSSAPGVAADTGCFSPASALMSQEEPRSLTCKGRVHGLWKHMRHLDAPNVDCVDA